MKYSIRTVSFVEENGIMRHQCSFDTPPTISTFEPTGPFSQNLEWLL